MEYLSVEEARTVGGMRLALTAGVPGPWSEAAKGIFKLRKIPYIAVLQTGGGSNEELVEWTGHRNAPTAMYNDEPARVTALDMINLAERLGKGLSLLPEDIEDRVRMFGLVNELAGENGMAWNARVMMFAAMAKKLDEEAIANNPMFRDYQYSPEATASAPGKIIAVLNLLTRQLKEQEGRGSSYYFGNEVSALDVYWACFSQMLAPMEAARNPMPDYLRGVWGVLGETLESAGHAVDDILLQHRDAIYEKHLVLPLDF